MKLTAELILAAAFIATPPCIHAQSNAFSFDDKLFLKESAQDNMSEVKLAQLALRISKNPTIITFAKKMIDDHQTLLGEAKPIAMKAGVTAPENLSMNSDTDYLKLKALSGDAFDKSYIETMVTEHHKDLEAARAEHEKTQMRT
jgi:putative membrane protein